MGAGDISNFSCQEGAETAVANIYLYMTTCMTVTSFTKVKPELCLERREDVNLSLAPRPSVQGISLVFLLEFASHH